MFAVITHGLSLWGLLHGSIRYSIAKWHCECTDNHKPASGSINLFTHALLPAFLNIKPQWSECSQPVNYIANFSHATVRPFNIVEEIQRAGLKAKDFDVLSCMTASWLDPILNACSGIQVSTVHGTSFGRQSPTLCASDLSVGDEITYSPMCTPKTQWKFPFWHHVLSDLLPQIFVQCEVVQRSSYSKAGSRSC